MSAQPIVNRSWRKIDALIRKPMPQCRHRSKCRCGPHIMVLQQGLLDIIRSFEPVIDFSSLIGISKQSICLFASMWQGGIPPFLTSACAMRANLNVHCKGVSPSKCNSSSWSQSARSLTNSLCPPVDCARRMESRNGRPVRTNTLPRACPVNPL